MPKKLNSKLFFFVISVQLCWLNFAYGWEYYGGDSGGSHYSDLNQINRDNVGLLEQVWEYSAGEIKERPERQSMLGFNGTPLFLPEEAGHSLVFCTALNRIIALDPITGKERWKYDAKIKLGPMGDRFLCRGIAYRENLSISSQEACRHSLFMGTKDLRLISIDALNGKPCEKFGIKGELNLMPEIHGDTPNLRLGDLQFTAPPVIIENLVVTGFADNTKFWRMDSPSGAIRAYDAESGELRWVFDPVPRGLDDPEASGWEPSQLKKTGGANAWTMLSVDEDRKMIFVPTATAGPNNYGGERLGDNRYANSVVALNALTGDVIWHFQIVHHDDRDLDLPAQPILVDINKDGEQIPVVIQLTKMGLIFVLHRETGKPIFPVEERKVPTDGVIAGEVLSPTQPYPLKPEPLIKPGISLDDAWGYTSIDRSGCKSEMEKFRLGAGLYEPPSLQGTLMMPGGSVNNWEGAAFDPNTNLLVLPITSIPSFIRLWMTEDIPPEILNQPRMGPIGPPTPITGSKFAYQMSPLLSMFMSPCVAPPWGEIAAIDMSTGDVRWRHPLGVLDKLARMPLPLEWGTPLAGGPTVTAGGVVFIGASADDRFRAFDIETGKKLWEAPMPSAAMATPMTYSINDKQYVVVMAGGHMFKYFQNISDYLVAFTLPD
ncbi:MAG: pyrroloquinoline quinone-dependent dehydrogenase [Pseudomonadota bacterium]|nr:pyrroloquinoline quinone-dependent dehydrogenase [Pseudomonadota bacterium]